MYRDVSRAYCLVSKNGKSGVATQSSKVKLVDLKSGSASHTLKGHRQPVLSVRWSTSNEHVLATGGYVHCYRDKVYKAGNPDNSSFIVR